MELKKKVVTSVGIIEYKRPYFECMRCGHKAFLADAQIADELGTVTLSARNIIALAGGSWGYKRACAYLKKLTGICVSGNTVRRISQAVGNDIGKWQQSHSEAFMPFIKGKGVTELQTDGTMVNTLKGWKEVRITTFVKREQGAPSDYAMMDKRKLPAPNAIFCFGQMESSQKHTKRWYKMAKNLRIHNNAKLHVIADGAAWIRGAAKRIFPNHKGCLDVYHACEHLHEVATILYKGVAIKETYERWKKSLLRAGWSGLQKELLGEKEGLSSYKWEKYMKKMYDYFETRQDALDYPGRLRAGLSIGSGQVEGACKNMVGRRLKQTGARWRRGNLNKMLGIVALLYSEQWDTYCRSTERERIRKL